MRRERRAERIDLPETAPRSANAGRRNFWQNMMMDIIG